MQVISKKHVSTQYERIEQLKLFKRFVKSMQAHEVTKRGPDEDGKGKFVDLYI